MTTVNDYSGLVQDTKHKMDNAIKALTNDFKGLSTGRASDTFLNSVIVEAYGTKMHINQLGTISTPDPSTIMIQVWDKSTIKIIEKGIVEANLGVSPVSDGQSIRINMPTLNEERRKELVKISHKYAENIRISVRHIRRDGIDLLKKMEKSWSLSEDDIRRYTAEIQKITDEYINQIEKLLQTKEKEIMTV